MPVLGPDGSDELLLDEEPPPDDELPLEEELADADPPPEEAGRDRPSSLSFWAMSEPELDGVDRVLEEVVPARLEVGACDRAPDDDTPEPEEPPEPDDDPLELDGDAPEADDELEPDVPDWAASEDPPELELPPPEEDGDGVRPPELSDVPPSPDFDFELAVGPLPHPQSVIAFALGGPIKTPTERPSAATTALRGRGMSTLNGPVGSLWGRVIQGLGTGAGSGPIPSPTASSNLVVELRRTSPFGYNRLRGSDRHPPRCPRSPRWGMV